MNQKFEAYQARVHTRSTRNAVVLYGQKCVPVDHENRDTPKKKWKCRKSVHFECFTASVPECASSCVNLISCYLLHLCYQTYRVLNTCHVDPHISGNTVQSLICFCHYIILWLISILCAWLMCHMLDSKGADLKLTFQVHKLFSEYEEETLRRRRVSGSRRFEKSRCFHSQGQKDTREAAWHRRRPKSRITSL